MVWSIKDSINLTNLLNIKAIRAIEFSRQHLCVTTFIFDMLRQQL